MQFIEIIKNNNWSSVDEIFLSLYPDQLQNSVAYKNLFYHLREIDPEVCSIQIALQYSFEEESNLLSYVDVSGIDTDSTLVALEYVPWRKWLGMSIDEKTADQFTALEIIAHCLFEMTFISFDENKIQEKFLKVKAMADDLRAATANEELHDTKSLEDLI